MILASLILLLAMVGVIVITINSSSDNSHVFVDARVDNNASIATAPTGVAGNEDIVHYKTLEGKSLTTSYSSDNH